MMAKRPVCRYLTMVRSHPCRQWIQWTRRATPHRLVLRKQHGLRGSPYCSDAIPQESQLCREIAEWLQIAPAPILEMHHSFAMKMANMLPPATKRLP